MTLLDNRPRREDGGKGKPIIDPIPPQIISGIQARQDYNVRVPPALDTAHNAMVYQAWIAGQYFLYGHFDEARKLYEPMYKDRQRALSFGGVAGKLTPVACPTAGMQPREADC